MTDEVPSTHHGRFQPTTSIATALLVLFVAAVIGTLHFVQAVPPGGGSSVLHTTTTSPPVTTTTTALPKNEVKVLVLNGTSIGGLARSYTDSLTAQGWNVQSPSNGPTERHTVVYYRPGFGHDAALVAGTVKAKRADIKPWSLPSKSYAGDDIVIVLGLNAAG